MPQKSKYQWDIDQLVIPKVKTLDLLKTPRGDHLHHMRNIAQNIDYKQDQSLNQPVQSQMKPNSTIPSDHFSLQGIQKPQNKINRFDRNWPPHKLEQFFEEDEQNDLIERRLLFGQDDEVAGGQFYERPGERQSKEEGVSPKITIFQKNKEEKKKRPKEKGLKSLSDHCYQIVKRQKQTTYRQVADGLIKQIRQKLKNSTKSIDKQQANVRRRVYDILNVFLSLGILSKKGRQIKFIHKQSNNNFIPNQQQSDHLQKIRTKQEKIKEITKKIQDLKQKSKKYQELIDYNQNNHTSKRKRLCFPFVTVIFANKKSLSFAQNRKDIIIKCEGEYKVKGDIEFISDLDLKNAPYKFSK